MTQDFQPAPLLVRQRGVRAEPQRQRCVLGSHVRLPLAVRGRCLGARRSLPARLSGAGARRSGPSVRRMASLLIDAVGNGVNMDGVGIDVKRASRARDPPVGPRAAAPAAGPLVPDRALLPARGPGPLRSRPPPGSVSRESARR
jgi:hypothetical protein